MKASKLLINIGSSAALLATPMILTACGSAPATPDAPGAEKAAEAKCGEGKCGGDKAAEKKCGEGKCGGAKDAEKKCGEGKCGGDAAPEAAPEEAPE